MSITVRHDDMLKFVVGIGDMVVSREPRAMLETHSLGSCIAVAAFDARAGAVGLLHFQLPQAAKHPEKAEATPFMFGDSGITAMLSRMFELGATRKTLVIKLAGGAAVSGISGTFHIGQRNYMVAKKLLWKNGIFIAAEDVGGGGWRNMRLEAASGRTWIKDSGGEYEI